MIRGSIKMFSYRNTFLIFQISKRAMEITTFTTALVSSLIKIPAKTENLLSVILVSNTLLMNCIMSSHIPDNLEHVYNKCSTFSSWLLHILQIPSENVICVSLISVLIHPWNNFQLKFRHFLGIHTLVKFTWNHISQSIMVVKSMNLLDQYSLDRTHMSLLFTKILYIYFAVKECNGFGPSPGIWNMVFKILLSFVFSLSSEWSFLSHSAGKDLRIVCISNMNLALYVSLSYN